MTPPIRVPLSYFLNKELKDSDPKKLATTTSKMKLTAKEERNVNKFINKITNAK